MKKSYIDWTYHSKNPIRRFAHRSRLKHSLSSVDLDRSASLLDFGCGRGMFLNQLAQLSTNQSFKLTGYEPYLEPMEDNKTTIISKWDQVKQEAARQGNYDYITAFEVFEHFNPDRQTEELQKIKSIIHPKGRLIISVPIEKGPIVLLKTFFRRINHPHNKHLYNFKNAIAGVFKRPLSEYRQEDTYLSHVGFYYDDLEKILIQDWKIERKWFSPFSFLGFYFNSQVFYNLIPKS